MARPWGLARFFNNGHRRGEGALGYIGFMLETESLHVGSEAEMRALGARLAREAKPGEVVLLKGELGAGKTTLVRGALAELGHPGPVRSPTFNLLQVFETDPPVLHVDLYRVGSGEGLGIEDYLSRCVCFVEWPDLEATWLDRSSAWLVEIQFEGQGRKVNIRRPAVR